MPPRKKNTEARTDERSPEVKRLLSILKTSMRSLGYTNRDIEKKLGLSGSYLSRLFSGLIDLKVDHIVSISRALGMDPDEMFQLAFPKRKKQPSVAALRLRETLDEANRAEGGDPGRELQVEDLQPDDETPPPAAKGEPPSELEQAMEKLMARTIQKLLGRLT